MTKPTRGLFRQDSDKTGELESGRDLRLHFPVFESSAKGNVDFGRTLRYQQQSIRYVLSTLPKQETAPWPNRPFRKAAFGGLEGSCIRRNAGRLSCNPSLGF